MGLYNIISTSRFNETLYYGNSMLPYQLSRCYNGNIADISISQDGRSYFYHFDYDEFNRLTSGMMYGMSGSRLKNDEFYSYDKMGNITSLYRLEEAGTVNGLDIHYRGNQLLKVTDDNKSFHGTYDFAIYPDLADSEQEYYYDGNGNETANLDKNIVAVRYNILNLPDTVQFGDGNRIVNYYLSSGIKLGSISRTYTTPLSVPLDKITNSTDPFVETKEWRNGEMHYKGDVAERIDIQDGYLQLCVNKTSGNLDSLKSYAYVCDHLGSVRQVCDAVTGNVVQSLEYYPSGLIFRSTNYDLQPDKYTGKELISMHGLNQYYSKARMQEFQIPHFTTRDPLCEKYYDLSPYGYCAGNPMRYVDPTGEYIESAWDIASLAMGVKSFVSNVQGGNVVGAIVDGVGIVLDAAAVALPVIPGGAGAAIKGVRAIDKAVDAAKTADKAVDGVSAMKRGIQNEAKVLESIGEVKNTAKYTVNLTRREKVTVIPDAITNAKVIEVKDVKSLSNTKQIRGERQVAQDLGKDFTIITGEKTHVSGNIPTEEIIRRKDIGPQ